MRIYMISNSLGKEVGPFEKEKTFRHVIVEVEETMSGFRREGSVSEKIEKSARLPSAVYLRFQIIKQPMDPNAVSTTWDSLSDLKASVHLPETVNAVENNGMITFNGKQPSSYREDLANKLSREIGVEVPEFMVTDE